MGKHKRKDKSRSRSRGRARSKRSLSKEYGDLRRHRKISRLEREKEKAHRSRSRSSSRKSKGSSNAIRKIKTHGGRSRYRARRSPSETSVRRDRIERDRRSHDSGSRSPSVAISLYSRGRTSRTTAHDSRSRSVSHCLDTENIITDTGPAQGKNGILIEDDSPVLVLSEDTLLSEETRNMLGPDPSSVKKSSFKLHPAVEAIWSYILPFGLSKEETDEFLKKYEMPENCKLLLPPKINPEIEAGMNSLYAVRDQTHTGYQALLSQSLYALGLALNALLGDDLKMPKESKEKVLVPVADAGRILCNLFNSISNKRRQLITPMMNKQIKKLVDKIPPGEFLFETNLGEKIQALRAMEKVGREIRPVPVTRFTPRAQPFIPGTSEKRSGGGGNKPSTSAQGNRGRPFHYRREMRTQKGRPSTYKAAPQKKR
ncbi:uncharacterized protein LOC126740185 [Anthonomus grandis grandis]|uniref:uncharacterized protein LOC126740185 n=1 Tax=Anthonomus grandis grandis TaxID=2921223 RepID=UPI002165B1AB|nr:uncharacterized protein LOC126740185 [Anthonomus grandis grandis]